jgi:hypothetical protein
VKSYSGQTVAAGGSAEVDLTPPPGLEWMVDHISVSSGSTTNNTCKCFLNQRFICGTNIGTADSADGSPVPVRNADVLRFVWAGVSSGAVCAVQVLVREDVVGYGLTHGA